MALLRFTFFIAALTGTALAADGTIILMRHAERAGGMAASVGISPAGKCRADAMAGMFADAGIKRIFATDVERTQQTAAPLARKLGIKTEILPAKDIAGLVAKIKAAAPGETVFVVGHSNTVPEIIGQLDGGTVPVIDDNEYNRIYIVTVHGAKASVLLLRHPGCTQ